MVQTMLRIYELIIYTCTSFTCLSLSVVSAKRQYEPILIEVILMRLNGEFFNDSMFLIVV
jgi:hypothetical protein